MLLSDLQRRTKHNKLTSFDRVKIDEIGRVERLWQTTKKELMGVVARLPLSGKCKAPLKEADRCMGEVLELLGAKEDARIRKLETVKVLQKRYPTEESSFASNTYRSMSQPAIQSLRKVTNEKKQDDEREPTSE